MSNITTIDWCAYRSKASPQVLVDCLTKVFPAHEDFEIRNEGRGWNGYQECHGVFLNEKRLGFIATGGDNQRGWSQVNLTGEAIPHIDKASESLTDCVERGKGQFK